MKFNSENPDDMKDLELKMKSLDMSLALWNISVNLFRAADHHQDAKIQELYESNPDLVWEMMGALNKQFNEIIEEYDLKNIYE